MQCFGLMGLPEIPTVDFVQLLSADTLVCESSNHLSRGPVNVLPTTCRSSSGWGWPACSKEHPAGGQQCLAGTGAPPGTVRLCCPALSAGFPSIHSTYLHLSREEGYAWCQFCYGCQVTKNKAMSQLATGRYAFLL